MRRANTILTAGVVLAASILLLWSSSAGAAMGAGGTTGSHTHVRNFLPWWGYGYGYTYPRYYVVAEKRGGDVGWSLFDYAYQVNTKAAQLAAEAEATTKANALIHKDVVRLTASATALRTNIAREKDVAKRQALQADLGKVQQEIAAKEGTVQPVVVYAVAGPLSSKQVDGFLVRLQDEAGPLNVHPVTLMASPPARARAY